MILDGNVSPLCCAGLTCGASVMWHPPHNEHKPCLSGVMRPSDGQKRGDPVIVFGPGRGTEGQGLAYKRRNRGTCVAPLCGRSWLAITYCIILYRLLYRRFGAVAREDEAGRETTMTKEALSLRLSPRASCFSAIGPSLPMMMRQRPAGSFSLEAIGQTSDGYAPKQRRDDHCERI